MTDRPPIPKRLAARIRGAQAKVLDARRWIETAEFNAVQDQARWDEFARNPEAFARKYYPGHDADSYPLQTNTTRVREKLDSLPRTRERNQRELEEAEALLATVEAEVLAEIGRMRSSNGRVPWPLPIEPFEQFFDRVIAEAYEKRDTAAARRDAYLAEVDRQYNEEIAALEIERRAELDALADDMKSWTLAERAEFKRVMGAIAQGLRDKSLEPNGIADFIRTQLTRKP